MRRVTRTLRRDDDGFGLIETIVALLIAGIVFGALATTLVASVQASLYGRQNQQATDFMIGQIETLRSMSYGSLSHTAADLAGDVRLATPCGSAHCLDTAEGIEDLVVAGTGALVPHTFVRSGPETNATDFTISSYVTELGDQSVAQARRVTVFVSWMNRGEERVRSTSTVIAFTQRGLPLPVFKLEMPVAAQSVNPGTDVVYDVTLTNQGAPDRWNLALSGGWSTLWDLYADTNGDGALDTTIDQLLADSTSDSIVDTGRLDPSTSIRFFMVRPAVLADVGVQTTILTATSFGQPTAAGAVKSVTATTTVTTGAVTPPPGPTPTTPPVTPEVACPWVPVPPAASVPAVTGSAYTVTGHVLHNEGVGDTPLQQQLYFKYVSGDEPYLARYSLPGTDTGRVLAPAAGTFPTGAAVLSLTDATRYADWSMQVSKKTWLDGTGVLRVWVAPQGATAGPVPMKVVLYSGVNSASGISRTMLAEAETAVTFGCGGFQEVFLTLPDIPQPLVAKNGWFGVRVVTAGAGNVRLGYDVPTQFPSTFTIGVKS